MARFLSAEWFAEMEVSLDAAATAVPLPGGETGLEPGDHVVLQQMVTGGPDGDVTYRVEVSRGRTRLTRTAGPADATVTTDYDTAAALHEGRLTLQDAFQTGRVKVGGNVATLVGRQAVLAQAGPFATPPPPPIPPIPPTPPAAATATASS